MEGVKKMEYSLECHELRPEETEELLNYYNRDILTNFIRLGSGGYFFYKEIYSIAEDVYNMPLRPCDTFIVTFPRSGTTWTQELVWLLQNNLDFEAAKATSLMARFPFVESGSFLKLLPPELVQNENFVAKLFLSSPEMLLAAPSPRFIKSHMPLSLLPPTLLDTTKVVYVARDPRDVAVSNYYHFRSSQFIPTGRDFKPYWNLFVQNKIFWSPFFDHVKEAWRQRNHPNMMFIFYEELSKDLSEVARRLAKFFGKEYSEEQYAALCDHLKFDNFRNNESVNISEWKKQGIMTDEFIRKGKSGGWREHFDEEMKQQAERFIAENLRDTDLRFPNTN